MAILHEIFRAARAAVLISYKNEGDDLAKNADFQRRNLSLVDNFVFHIKMMGTIDFSR